MDKIHQTTLVLGEGITEFYFLNSLKDDYKILRSVLFLLYHEKNTLLMMMWEKRCISFVIMKRELNFSKSILCTPILRKRAEAWIMPLKMLKNQ